MAAPKTPLERLNEIETAITEVLTSGQAYTLGDRTFTRATVFRLNEMRSAAWADYQRETLRIKPFVSRVDLGNYL